MKQILAFLLLLCTLTASAQDIIVKKDGTAIQAIVKEILSSEVKYKKFSNPDGPTYTVAIADLLSITYKNGEVDRFNSSEPTKEDPVQFTETQQQESSINSDYILDGRRTKSDAELLQIYQNDHPVFVKAPIEISNDFLKKGKRKKIAGVLIEGIAVAYIGCFIPASLEMGSTEVIVGLTCGIVPTVLGISLICSGNKDIRKSRSIQTATIFQQDFSLGKHSTLSADVNLMRDSYRNQYAPAVGFHINF